MFCSSIDRALKRVSNLLFIGVLRHFKDGRRLKVNVTVDHLCSALMKNIFVIVKLLTRMGFGMVSGKKQALKVKKISLNPSFAKRGLQSK
jgi:hypothetical protein